MVTPRFIRPGPAVALLASMTAALLASSCGWLTGDIFPAWVPFVDARADLAAVADAEEIGTIRHVSTVEYVPMKDAAGADVSKVLVYIEGLDGQALAAFEPDGLGLSKTWVRNAGALSTLGPRLVPTPDGFIAGNLAFSADDLETEPTTITMAMPGGLILAFGEPTSYFVIDALYDGTMYQHNLFIAQYDDISIAAPIMVRSASWILNLVGTTSRLIDAEFFPAEVAGAYTLNILVETSNGAYAASFGYSAATIIDGLDPVLTGPLPINDGRGWLTVDGVVTLSRSNGTTLARYAYGAVGTADVAATPLDTLTFSGDTENFNIASFSADGDRWYLYDGLRKLVYAMRTWW